MEKHEFLALSGKPEFDTNVNFWPENIQFTPEITIAHSIRLVFLRLFLFLKVKSDHFSRFYGHFSDFSPVADIQQLNMKNRILTGKYWDWASENKTAWKLVKFVIQPNLFELHPSIFEDSMAISSFWHILVILQTSEKSLKWPWNLEKWSDFTFKKRKRRKKRAWSNEL